MSFLFVTVSVPNAGNTAHKNSIMQNWHYQITQKCNKMKQIRLSTGLTKYLQLRETLE